MNVKPTQDQIPSSMTEVLDWMDEFFAADNFELLFKEKEKEIIWQS